ncbi:TIM barrel protein [Candidatus Woesearchaeota archaeon]|nr:TIM barrel protein [Candidatus Woesearchaeota archaeon]
MIKFGPGGTAGLGYGEGIPIIAGAGLSALEIEFTYGVRMSNEEAKKIGSMAQKYGISLSVHAPYYINLASKDAAKQEASIKRIMDSCERAHYLKASPVVYHSGFFQKQDAKRVREMITRNTSLIMDKIRENNWKVKISPELTGKKSQFGSIPELLDLRRDTGCEITVDFAHQRARQQGRIDYAEVLKKLKPLKHLHAHFSGIEWTDKGERRHLGLTKEEIIPFARAIKRADADITIINEGPEPIKDAKLIKHVFDTL